MKNVPKKGPEKLTIFIVCVVDHLTDTHITFYDCKKRPQHFGAQHTHIKTIINSIKSTVYQNPNEH